jgi:hypothetical protein
MRAAAPVAGALRPAPRPRPRPPPASHDAVARVRAQPPRQAGPRLPGHEQGGRRQVGGRGGPMGSAAARRRGRGGARGCGPAGCLWRALSTWRVGLRRVLVPWLQRRTAVAGHTQAGGCLPVLLSRSTAAASPARRPARVARAHAHSGLTGTRGLREFREAHPASARRGARVRSAAGRAPRLPSEHDPAHTYGRPADYRRAARWHGQGCVRCVWGCAHPKAPRPFTRNV